MPQTVLENVPTDIMNKVRYKQRISIEEVNILANYRVSKPEIQRRSLPEVVLSDIELEFLKALVEGRNKFEIVTALKLLGESKSYNQILGKLIKKFDAINLPNAIYKAIKIGIID